MPRIVGTWRSLQRLRVQELMSTDKNSEIIREGALLLCEALLCGETWADACVVATDYVLQRVPPSESHDVADFLRLSALQMLFYDLRMEVCPDGRARPWSTAGFLQPRRTIRQRAGY